MTYNQIEYQKYLEMVRTNKENEYIRQRANELQAEANAINAQNAVSNRIGAQASSTSAYANYLNAQTRASELAETSRHNAQVESENLRHNTAAESETQRSNLAKELETNRANKANESLQGQDIWSSFGSGLFTGILGGKLLDKLLPNAKLAK